MSVRSLLCRLLLEFLSATALIGVDYRGTAENDDRIKVGIMESDMDSGRCPSHHVEAKGTPASSARFAVSVMTYRPLGTLRELDLAGRFCRKAPMKIWAMPAEMVINYIAP